MNLGRMTSADSAAAYREHLRAPVSWYLIGVLFGVALGLIFAFEGAWQSVAGFAAGTVIAAWVVYNYGRASIELADGRLTAGPATLPLTSLGEASALSPDKARALRMHEGDPRAFMLLRSYVRTAVRIEVVDPQDPHPYLYLSSRHPEQLAAALARASAAAR